MIVPTVPAFVAGDTSVAKLQQLASCVSFLTVATAFPMWHVYKTNQQSSVTSGTWTSISWQFIAFDSDHMAAAGGNSLQFHTQGYFVMEACVPIVTQASAFSIGVSFLWTAGAGNPHFSSGTTNRFGMRSGVAAAAVGMNEAICLDDICPVVCYPGDTVAVQVFPSATCVIDSNTPAGATQGRFVTNFTGRWIRQGS